MRFAWHKYVVITVFLFAFSVAAQTNPHTGIRWPANCSHDNYQTYNWLLNSCIFVGPIGPEGQVQFSHNGGFGSDGVFLYNPANQTLSIPNLSVPGNAQINFQSGQIHWPNPCVGVYAPGSDTCVPPGTAANPGGTTGQAQFNVGGAFGGKTLGPDLIGSANLDSNGARSFQFGYHCYGDSISQGTGSITLAYSYCQQLNHEENMGPFYNAGAGAGARAGDMANYVFQKEAPDDTQNPVVTMMIGTNDANGANTPQSYINQTEGSAAAWTALSATDKVLAIATGQVVTAMINARGTGWLVNDTATYTCATTNAVFTVNSITSAGGVNTITITNAGVGCSTSGAGAAITPSGAGTGFTVNVIATPIQTQTGTWTNDATFAAVTGLQTTTTSTITDPTCYVGPNGVAYFWYAQFGNAANSATYSVSINGTTLTDDFTGSSTLNAQSPPSTTYGPHNLGTTFETVVMARFHGLTPGANSNCRITATASAGNPATVIGWGFPPSRRYHGNTAPAIFMGGVPYQANDANSAATATYNGYNLALANQLAGDGLMTKFVDVRSYIDPIADFLGTPNNRCFAAISAGLHPNSGALDGSCGHGHLYLAFDDAIKGTNTNQPQALVINPTTTFPNLNPAGTAGNANTWVPGLSYGNYNLPTTMFTTFQNTGVTNSFGQPQAAGSFAIAFVTNANGVGGGGTTAFCYSPNGNIRNVLPKDITCVAYLNSDGLWLSPKTQVETGTNNYASVPVTFEAEVTNGSTWGRDVSTFFSSHAAAGANPEMDFVMRGGNQTTNNRCLWLQNGGATSTLHGIKLCAANAVGAFDAIITNANLTGTRTYNLPDVSGTLAAVTKVSNSITPTAVTASTCAEQIFSFAGMQTGQGVSVSPPSSVGAHVWIGGARVSSAGQVGITFCADPIGGTPAAGTYIAVAF